ncbi:MAG: CRISPR-associated endoribonuclease Cas6 [Bacteroidota bacterium]
MRIHVHLTPNREVVPFNYQPHLAGAFHKWLGVNDYHDDLSLYSLSWLSRGRIKAGKGLDFSRGCSFFISTPEVAILKAIVGGIQRDPQVAFGMAVREVVLQPTPDFGGEQTFFLQSPVLIKRQLEKRTQFYFPQDQEADQLLTETLQHKLQKAGMEDAEISVGFDRSYPKIKTKVATYKGIDNKGTFCPVHISGDPRAVAFAWEVGIGNSTGIGFGALK